MNTRKCPRILIIIPAHNEEGSIADVISKLKRLPPEYKRVIVNDGSTDNTASIVEIFGEDQIKLPVNLGYGIALQTGMKYALQKGYEIIVCMDADGQHQPEDVPGLVQSLLENNADLVIGSRFSEGRPYATTPSRQLGQLLFSHFTRLLIGHRIFDTSSGFKAMRKVVCENVIQMAFLDFHIETITQLSLCGFKIIEYPITVQARLSGKSMYNFTSIFSYPIKTMFLTLVSAFDVLISRRSK